jgi:hypothetical protein
VNKSNLKACLNTVKEISWENIMQCIDPCESDNFNCELKSAFDTSFPIYTTKI